MRKDKEKERIEENEKEREKINEMKSVGLDDNAKAFNRL